MTAVHISAAITAYARIHMYPFISRPDCLYTDTDSVFLQNPLPDEYISSTELGKFKLESTPRYCIFAAPKAYFEYNEDKDNVLKFKGAAKEYVTEEWFHTVLQDPYHTEQHTIHSDFRVSLKHLKIMKEKMNFKLSLPDSTKRLPIYHPPQGSQEGKPQWVDTQPIKVRDVGNEDANTILEFLRKDLEKKDSDTTEKKPANESLEKENDSQETNNKKTSWKQRCGRAPRSSSTKDRVKSWLDAYITHHQETSGIRSNVVLLSQS
ncbi:DNA polymerase-like [Andrographis paniculata]|uniref:DNA polymerase-like n=1 Tax=Andrographis paniculata TaxID=175694 RepID=UPI0021E6F5D9|nr:DNA polymerase-like [Andrographis paniculata]XP_051115592.1 DNA polymerase-like [Andrographis paniculata]